MLNYDDLNNVEGCLIGGAVGDALGYPVEFYEYGHIVRRFGTDGIKDYKLDMKSGLALISDDTQMVMFTANAMLNYILLDIGLEHSEDRCIEYISEAYKAWLETQDGYYSTRRTLYGSMRHKLWVYEIEQLWNIRAPGSTCITSLHKKDLGSLENRINNSKGCGGVMRVAPIGLALKDTSDDFIFSVACKSAALTHGHIDGWAPAGMLALIINKLRNTTDGLYKIIKNSINFTENYIREYEDSKDSLLVSKSKLACNLAMKDDTTNDVNNIKKIGEGWTGEEALAIAIYCSLKYKDNFEKAVQVAVNHGGDSDSTGAITGNIVGTLLGYEAIPEKFKEKLEVKDDIMTLANDLCEHILYSDRYEKRS